METSNQKWQVCSVAPAWQADHRRQLSRINAPLSGMNGGRPQKHAFFRCTEELQAPSWPNIKMPFDGRKPAAVHFLKRNWTFQMHMLTAQKAGSTQKLVAWNLLSLRTEFRLSLAFATIDPTRFAVIDEVPGSRPGMQFTIYSA